MNENWDELEEELQRGLLEGRFGRLEGRWVSWPHFYGKMVLFDSSGDLFGMATYSASSKTWRCYVGSVEFLMYGVPWWSVELERIVADFDEADSMIRFHLEGRGNSSSATSG
jgi:hypothetical protein